MKTIQFIVLMMLTQMILNAQNEKFNSAMLSNMKKAGNLTTVAEFQELANTFERIAVSEKKEWTPWYYGTLNSIGACAMETDTDKKLLLIQQGQKMVDEGLKVKNDETELMVLKVTLIYMEMAANPSKAMELMPLANELLEKAKTINPENPRIYLIQAEAVYNTPAEFGGGKSNTLPIITKAKEKFDKFVPENQLSPNWGKERCEEIFADCQDLDN